jgi:putative transposase
MTDEKHFPQRKSPRLPDYDYSQEGVYFVTICLQNPRVHLFGRVIEGEMWLNNFGAIVWHCWQDLPNHYDHIDLDAFIVMPNHIHAIILIVSQHQYGLSEVVRALKSYSAKRINKQRNTTGTKIWQRSFHDHIIRNEADLNRLREYTIYNAAKWRVDTFYRPFNNNTFANYGELKPCSAVWIPPI